MNYKTTIGLEIHVQLKTKSKMFCRCDNNAENAPPNSLVCPVCLGLPGVLPVANRQAIEWVLKTGLALNSKIAALSRFDRKHYFYPDLPKNYQISQYDMPFASHGWLEITNPKLQITKINLTRIHLEEDAGKLIHAANATLIDFNRAGTPLMEIVTEPEISSPREAKVFMQEMRAILRYLDVSDADMEKGHLRCDANISLCELKTQNSKLKTLGTPVEIKNLNSFRMVERALLYEEKRQKEAIEKGEKIVKETRGWDDKKGITYSQRSKEIAQDYRYFPEPDLPPFETSKFNLAKIKAEIPELPATKRQRYIDDLRLSSQDAAILSFDRELSAYFEKVAEKATPQIAANWVLNELKMDGIPIVKPENLAEMLVSLEKKEISGKMAKDILAEMIETGKRVSEIIAEKGFKSVGSGRVSIVIEKVIKDNGRAVHDYQSGKKEALGFLVGQVMRECRGQAEPQVINKLLEERINQ